MQILTPDGYKDASELHAGDELCAFDLGTGTPIVNTIIDIHQVTNSDYLQLNNYQPTPFKYIRINGTFSFFQDQSIWVDGNIKHCSELEVGDTIYSDTDTDILVTSVEVIDDLNYWWRLEVSGDASYIADGVQVHNASRFLITGGGSVTWDASNTAIWSATSGGGTGASVPGASDVAVMDGSSGGGTCTLGYSPTITNITMGAFTGTFASSTYNPTMNTFSGTGTAVRTLDMGSGQWSLTANNAGLWQVLDMTNFTVIQGLPINCTYSGASGTRTLAQGGTVLTVASLVDFNITAGTDIVTQGGNGIIRSIDFTGFSGTWANTNRFILGSYVVFSSTMNCGATTANTTTFNGAITQTITSNGTSWGNNITVTNNAYLTFADAFTSSSNLNTAGGAIDDNGQIITVASLSTSTSSAKTLINSGTINITGNAGGVISCGIMTNLTVTQTGSINLTYAGSTGTRTITVGTTSGTQARALSINVTAGSDTVVVTGSSTIKSLDFTGFTGTYTPSTYTLFRNFILPAAVTCSSASATLTFGATFGSYIISLNGNTTFGTGGTAVVVNAPGATYTFASAFASLSTLTHTAGALDFATYNTTCDSFASSNSNVRSLSLGSGTVLLTGTGTVWNTSTTTNLTFDAGTSTITMNNASSSSKTFSGGALTFNNIRMTGAGTGTFIMGTTTTPMTLNEWIVDTAPHTVQIFAGKTINATTLTWSGTSGNLNTFQSTSNGTAWYINVASGTVVENYISLQDSWASGGATFYAGANSTNVSNNMGWIFTNAPVSAQSSFHDGNHTPTLMGTDDSNGEVPRLVYANATAHSLNVEDNTTGNDYGPITSIHDGNHVPVLMAVSSADGKTPIPVYVDSSGNLLINSI